MEFDEVKRALKTNKSLHLNSVPQEAREQFINLAESKFSGNYGIALAYIMEVLTTFYPSLYEHEVRLNKLEGKGDTSIDKPRTRIDGRVIGGQK
ncbi:MAG: hypothetical protein WC307_06695 [Candidatus Nanoarchaeia archaeon]|jgi:hypothetical protein